MCTGDMAAQLRSISVRVIVRAVPEFVFQHDVNMSHVGRAHWAPPYEERGNVLFLASPPKEGKGEILAVEKGKWLPGGVSEADLRASKEMLP